MGTAPAGQAAIFPPPGAPGSPSNHHQITDFFRDIANQHGSHAIWLPQSGLLATEDDQEE